VLYVPAQFCDQQYEQPAGAGRIPAHISQLDRNGFGTGRFNQWDFSKQQENMPWKAGNGDRWIYLADKEQWKEAKVSGILLDYSESEERVHSIKPEGCTKCVPGPSI
jgi:hypothetical protein